MKKVEAVAKRRGVLLCAILACAFVLIFGLGHAAIAGGEPLDDAALAQEQSSQQNETEAPEQDPTQTAQNETDSTEEGAAQDSTELAAPETETKQNSSSQKGTSTQSLASPLSSAASDTAPLGASATGTDPFFDIYWVTGLPTTRVISQDSNGHAIEIKDTPGQDQTSTRDYPYVSAQVELSIGHTSNPIKPGELQIALPRQLFKQWDWDNDGNQEYENRDLLIGVGAKPTRSGRDFWYYYATKNADGSYTEDENGEYLILENYVDYNSNASQIRTFTCTISYPYQPSRVDATQTHELKADYIVKASGYQINKKNDTIKATIETETRLTSVVKAIPRKDDGTLVTFTNWNPSWGEFTDTGLEGTSDDYVYVAQTIKATLAGSGSGTVPNRPYTVWISTENPGVDIGSYKGDSSGKSKVVAFASWTGRPASYDASSLASRNYSPFHTLKYYEDYMANDGNPLYNPVMYKNGTQVGLKAYVFGKSAVYRDYTWNSTESNGIISAAENSVAMTAILVAYPKDFYEQILESPEGPLYLTNTASVKLQPLGSNRVDEQSGSAYSKDQRAQFKYKDGILGVTKYEYVGRPGQYMSNPSYSTRSYSGGSRRTGTTPALVRGEDQAHPGSGGYYDDTKEAATLMGARWMLESGQTVKLFPFYLGDPTSDDNPGFFAWNLTLADPKWNPGTEIVIEDTSVYGQSAYSLEMIDDMVFLQGEPLQAGDYEMVSTIYTSTGELYFSPSDFSFKSLEYVKNSNPDDPEIQAYEDCKPDIYVRWSGTEEWTLAKAQAEKGGVLGDNLVMLPTNDAGQYPSEVKYVFKTKAASVRPDVYINVQLKPTAHVKDILSRTPDPTAELQVLNVASFGLRDANGKQWNIWDESTIEGMNDIRNYVKTHDQQGGHGLPANMYLSHERTYQYLTGFDPETSYMKRAINSKDNAETLISSRTYELLSTQSFKVTTTDPQATLARIDELGIAHGQKNVVFYDLIPEGGTFDPENMQVTYYEEISGSWTNKIDAKYSYETFSDYNGSGRTLLKVTVSFPEGQDSDWGQRYNPQTGELNMGTRVSVQFPVVFSWEDLALLDPPSDDASGTNKRQVINRSAVYVPESGDGYPDDPTKPVSPSTEKGFDDDNINSIFKDLLADGDNSTNDVYYDSQESTFNIATASITGYSKHVKAESESSYRINSAVKPGELYSYRLRYAPDAGTEAKDIIIYDVLEYAWIDPRYLMGDFADKYDLTKRFWLGTFDHVDVSEAKKLGVNVKVYYSTVDRKTMQEGMDAYSDASSPSVAPCATLSNTAYWTATTPEGLAAMSDAEKAAITAIAFDCSEARRGGDFVLKNDPNKMQLLQLYIHMKAPDLDEIQNGKDMPKYDKQGNEIEAADGVPDGSYTDPEFVYAYNNSFLAARSKNQSATEWSSKGVRMSDGTTVRTSEPNPPIFKQESDDNETAGMTQASDDPDNNTVTLDSADEAVSYTITTRVPTLGVDASGEDERNSFTVVDKLVSVLEFTKTNLVSITVGQENHNAFFGWDPTAPYDGHKGYFKLWTGRVDDNGEKIFEEKYFDSYDEFPAGFTFGLRTDYAAIVGNYPDDTEFAQNPAGMLEYNSLNFKLDYETKMDEDGRSVVVEDGYDRVNEFAGEKVSITFWAKVVDGVTLASYEDGKIPNTASYRIPNHPTEQSNTVYVQHEPPDTPPPSKGVSLIDGNGEQNQEATHQNMDSLDQTIHYTVHSQVPQDHQSLMLSDTLVPALEMDTSTLTLTLRGKVKLNELGSHQEQVFDQMGNPKYDFDAFYATGKTKDDVEYGENGLPTNVPFMYKTVYDFVYDEEGTPKTNEIEINRTFNAEELAAIAAQRSSGFSFNADTNGFTVDMQQLFINIRGDYYLFAEYVTETTTDPETGEETTTKQWVDGEYGNNDPYDCVNGPSDFALGGLEILIDFDAKIKDGADLSAYKVDDGETLIPNEVTYRFGNNAEEKTEPVTVTPPDVSKVVNEKTHVDLASWDEVFTYKISTFVPRAGEDEEITSVVFWDELEPVLEFVEPEATVFSVAGEEQDNAKVKCTGQKLEVDLTEYVETNPGSLVLVEFKAKIKEGTTLEDLSDYVNDTSEAEIPNEATVSIKPSTGPERELKSKPVTVTPPPIEKRVNGKLHEDLKTRDEVFTYSIKTWIPVADKTDTRATAFQILDTLEPVLEFVDEDATTLTIGGKELSAIEVSTQTTREGQKISFDFTEAQISDNPKALVEFTFKARIKDGADLSPYVTEETILVPNTASYKINNDPEVESNTVTVTPPEKPVKLVNGKEHVNLLAQDEVFTYTVDAYIKPTYTKMVFSDTLEPVLEFVGEPKVLIGDEPVEAQLSIEGKTITAELGEELLAEQAGKLVTLSFDARIVDGADLSSYELDKQPAVPNKAELELNGDPKMRHETKPVTVTPPPDDTEILKLVNNKHHEDLVVYDEVFNYTVSTWIPVASSTNETVNSFAILDTLEPVLEFVNEAQTTVTIDGVELTAEELKTQVVREGQNITLTLTPEQIAAYPKKLVVLSFDARIKNEADLRPYTTNDTTLVPNTARYKINNDAEVESNTVTVTPPPDEDTNLYKTVNKKTDVSLKSSQEVFEYTLTMMVPRGAKVFTIEDTLEPVLEFASKDVKVSIGGVALTDKDLSSCIKISGQKLKVSFSEELTTSNYGKTVVVSFTAKIRPGAKLDKYRTGGSVTIPNTASYIVDNDATSRIDSNTVVVRLKELPDTSDPSKLFEMYLSAVSGVSALIGSRALRRKKRKA